MRGLLADRHSTCSKDNAPSHGARRSAGAPAWPAWNARPSAVAASVKCSPQAAQRTGSPTSAPHTLNHTRH